LRITPHGTGFERGFAEYIHANKSPRIKVYNDKFSLSPIKMVGIRIFIKVVQKPQNKRTPPAAGTIKLADLGASPPTAGTGLSAATPRICPCNPSGARRCGPPKGDPPYFTHQVVFRAPGLVAWDYGARFARGYLAPAGFPLQSRQCAPFLLLPFFAILKDMTIEQTVEIPADHRLYIDVPPYIPEGKATITLSIVPANRDGASQNPGAWRSFRGIFKGSGGTVSDFLGSADRPGL
jgi:hypothetical protein